MSIVKKIKQQSIKKSVSVLNLNFLEITEYNFYKRESLDNRTNYFINFNNQEYILSLNFDKLEGLDGLAGLTQLTFLKKCWFSYVECTTYLHLEEAKVLFGALAKIILEERVDNICVKVNEMGFMHLRLFSRLCEYLYERGMDYKRYGTMDDSNMMMISTKGEHEINSKIANINTKSVRVRELCQA